MKNKILTGILSPFGGGSGRITFLFLLFSILNSSFSIAQSKLDTVRIKTSAICDDCKERIEHDLSFEKGVKKATLDLDTKFVTVVYNPTKTNRETIMAAITKIGYDADTMKADAKAFKRLPECCQKPDSEHH